jgi:type VI secretion system secreted protein VgrG
MSDSAQFDQQERLLAITTRLRENNVLLTELDGIDEISKPFLFKLKLMTDQPAADVTALLMTEATIEFGPSGIPDARRIFRGWFRRLTRTGVTDRTGAWSEWEAELVPRFWFMSLRTNLRIFSEAKLPEIISTLFAEHGVASPTMPSGGLMGQVIDYCVQHRESDFHFISRCLERFGLFYVHRHSTSDTKMVVLANNTGAVFPPPSASGGSVSTIARDFNVRSGEVTTRDFDYRAYREAENSRPRKIGGAALEPLHDLYDYPGLDFEKSWRKDEAGLLNLGHDLADIAMEREEARYNLFRGTGDYEVLDAGVKVKVPDVGQVLVTAVRHTARDYSHWADEDWAARGQERFAPYYRNEFTAMPLAVPYRPELATPRPVVRGPETAKVTQSEQATDGMGRVKVRFHWERLGTESCWLRVSQGWASSGYGQFHLPQVNDEVIVDFLSGDPDRPIVTGRVYNGVNKAPFPLPSKHTQSGIKTRRDNQLRFDDESDNEEVYVRAAKDLLTEVMDSETRKVGLGSGPGTRTTEIKGDDTLKVQQGNLAVETQQGSITVKAAASTVTIESPKEIVLKVGSSKVTVNQQGVTIEGTMVEVKGTGSAKIESPMTTAGGSGITSVTGSLIKIG